MDAKKQKRKVAPREPLSILNGLSILLRYMVVMPLRLLASLVGWSGRQVWRATSGLGRGAWWIAKVPWRITQWAFGFGEMPEFENIYQRQAYLGLKRRYRRHWWRNLHTMGFAIISGALGLQTSYQFLQVRYWEEYWVRYLTNQVFWVGVVLIIWLLVLLAHSAFVRTKDQEDEALETVLTQYRDAPLAEKRKHNYYEEVEAHVFDALPDYSHLEEYEYSVEDDPEWTSTTAERIKARRRRG